jgi:hypothetical protein
MKSNNAESPSAGGSESQAKAPGVQPRRRRRATRNAPKYIELANKIRESQMTGQTQAELTAEVFRINIHNKKKIASTIKNCRRWIKKNRPDLYWGS